MNSPGKMSAPGGARQRHPAPDPFVEAVWKACQKVLAAMENIRAASPNETIRATRALGWLSDEDAPAAMKLGEERNLAVHMYRDQVGRQIEAHLAAHAALLRRWLGSLQRRAAAGD
jgi:hypothetical protein